jgi:cyclase
MLRTRVMPCLLLKDSKLVKTIKFKNPDYVGDPINAVMIYNEKEVDELIFLDVTATVEGKRPPFKVISEIATECFMPFTYGGGINNISDVKEIFKLGVEKIAVNSHAVEHPEFLAQIAETNGSQSVVVAIDVKKTWSGHKVFTKCGTKNTGLDPAEWAKEAERSGAGEILLTSIDMDGTMEGYDTELISKVAKAVRVPVIACGGAGKIQDFRKAVDAGASAVAAGSMVVYHGAAKGVLINFPRASELRDILP